MLNTVCRVCLAMDVPMHIIAGTPLQYVYENLTNISLKVAHRPVVACYMCYSQLRKCHIVKVRSLIANEVLTQLLLDGEAVNVELLTAKTREVQKKYELTQTPHECISIAGAGHKPFNANIDALTPQCKEEIDAEVGRCIEHLTFEESEDEQDIDGVRTDVEIEQEGSMDREEISEQLENAVYSERDVLTDAGDVKPEKPAEIGTVRRCIDYLKFEDSENENYNVREEITNNRGTKYQQRISLPRKELINPENENDNKRNEIISKRGAKKQRISFLRKGLIETVTRKCIDYLKLEDSELGEDSEGVIRMEIENNKTEGATDGREIDDEVLQEAVDAKGIEAAGATPAKKSKQIHAGKIQDGSTLTPGGKNIKKSRARKTVTVVEAVAEVTSRNTGRYVLRGAKANNRQVLTNSMYSDAAIRSDVSVISDDCAGVTAKNVSYVKSSHPRTLIRKQKKIFECEICNGKFSYQSQLKTHLRVHTGEKPYECDICKYKFRLKGHLKTHLSVHTGEKPYECEVCKVKLRSKSSLKAHLRIHTGEKPYECEICNVSFNHKGYLKTHLRIHTGEKRYECNICKVKFCYKGYLVNHLSIHTGEKPYECEICKAKFRHRYHLKTHLRIHTGEKPYQCDICNVTFNWKAYLKAHLRTHTGEKPYECEICKAKFSFKSNLTKHTRIHTGEKPYECEICKVRFAHKSVLQGHLNIHTKEKPYECEICKVRFSHKTYITAHLRIHTGEKRYQCQICQFRFTTKSHLNRHLNVHTGVKPYECEICKAKFGENTNLKKHLRIHTGERPYQCDICEVRFTEKHQLKIHLRIHTGEKPYECEICKARFNRKRGLNAHQRFHTGEKFYECEICKLRFSEKRLLTAHFKEIHTEKKPYECGICKFRFGRKDHLKKHSKRHL